MAVVVGVVVAISAIASIYQLIQLLAARRFFYWRRLPEGTPDDLPPVTILKPLKGEGIDLYANLASFCRQDYPRYQIVFGVEDAADPAVAIVRKVMADFPEHDLALSVGWAEGTNRKVANLIHMMPHAKHDVLVPSDGDIRVRPDYLATMVTPLTDETRKKTVGLTTCLYRGRGYFGLSRPGKVTVEKDGITSFEEVDKGKHRFLTVSKEQAARCREAFANLASQPPGK